MTHGVEFGCGRIASGQVAVWHVDDWGGVHPISGTVSSCWVVDSNGDSYHVSKCFFSQYEATKHGEYMVEIFDNWSWDD